MPEERSALKALSLYLIAIFFVIVNLSNIKIAGFANLIPLFDLMMVFYFSIFKNIFPIWFLFLLGIWNDALNGNPLGTTALCYIILTRLFLLFNIKMMIRENFQQIWKQFIAFCASFLFMKWTLISVFSNTTLNIVTPLAQLVLSASLYIFMHRFFDYLSTKLFEN